MSDDELLHAFEHAAQKIVERIKNYQDDGQRDEASHLYGLAQKWVKLVATDFDLAIDDCE
jgi:hypothetical protein